MKVIDFKKASCRNCYKCVRSCAVKAIKVADGQATIMEDHCILCGTCLEVCPQNAKTFVSDLEMVRGYIAAGIKTVVSLAPAYLGILDCERPGQVIDALLKLGFSEVRETAEGAAYVTNAYGRLLEAGEMDNIITTCCPSVNDFVEKYYPDLVGKMAPVVSPMIAHGKLIKAMYGPSVKVVFIGPCIAKKMEAEGDGRTSGFVDAVLTFEELEAWLAESGIDLKACDDLPPANPDPKVNRLYPVSSGVMLSVLAKKKQENYKKIFIDGVEDLREVFEDIRSGRLKGCFIEANMCPGGCIKGPAANKLHISKYRAKMTIEDQIENEAPSYPEEIAGVDLHKRFRSAKRNDPMPTEEQIREILRATGKNHSSQELNCGACGYSTCRDKAIAVFQGKAELGMCLPYAFDKAESMAGVVMDTTPEMVLIVNSAYQIVEFNKKAEQIFKISRSDAVGRMIFDLMDVDDFDAVLASREPIMRKKIELKAYGAVLLENIVYVESHDVMLAVFQDVTAEESENERRMMMRMDTIDVAQQIIDKQMMVAQEIAGLLGESTAETKVILTQLRDSLINDQKIEKTPNREII